ncbi:MULTISPECIES: FMN-binding protein [unclassified Streptomyces]|uniref:FMN-binding protein n=1 Tax=unclassified Streptomyces TaxID=2593676 RepID=UPI002366AEAF|nr:MULTISPECIES: FMN-binding protein [unclassified Streptomyces]MDF3146894.1 FMN-binding protein [Streptomyces sp. T21Q-yed]WDF42145.1 FMN-binding protein [Streptomyces sp. T12]
MKRAIPVLVLSVAGLVPVWLYEPSLGTASTEAATPASTPSVSSSVASGSGSGSTVVKGSTVQTDKGPVQVQVTFQGSKITAVKMLQQPNHPQTTAAVPKLIAETLQAQSADIDTVSGATITSDGYRESLQAAIDANTESASSSAASPSASESAAAQSQSQSVDGSTVNTDKGPVQVQVTFEGDKIASVKMLQQPNHPQTTAAVPKLIAETLQAQSADIDTVSGATITSDGYRESLQAAIDAKG